MSSTLLVTQDHFANCSLLVFSLPQVCSRSPSPTCAPLARATTSCPTSPVVLQELPALPNFTSCPASFHVLRYLICCPTRVPHPTLPHQSSCKCSHILRYLISCPARVPTSYATSSAVLQEFPHPTLPHQLSCKSSHILATLHHQSSRKCSHILRYLVSCPASVPTSYTTHQLSCKNYQFV